MTESLSFVPAGADRDGYLPLLRLADDSEAQVRSYYQTGDLFAYLNGAGAPIGVTLVTSKGPHLAELKAVAVNADVQGKGIGQRMVRAVLDELRRRGFSRVVVGTASCGIAQLAFYQKVGFRFHSVERDFFTAARGYRDGIKENGIPLRDMVWMDQELS